MALLDQDRIPTRPPRDDGTRRDLLAVLAAVALVALATGVGLVLLDRGVPILVSAPPLLAQWVPHVGPGTVPAVLLAAAVVVWGPGLARRLPWPVLLAGAWAVSLAWTFSLALIDGFQAGFAGRLTTLFEYLHEVPRITDIPAFLDGFAALITNGQPGFWTTHVAGHPPLATLIYVWLDRLGLGGGVWASSVTIVVGTSAVVAVAIALRTIGTEDLARRVVPFVVLFPGAVWVGVSADGLFAAVLAWGVALVALAGTRQGPVATHLLALAAGLVLGAALFLNYGLSVGMLVPIAAVVALRAWRVVPGVVLGAGAVTAVFLAYGFWWFDGYEQLLIRYVQPGEFGGMRPYSYFVWANLAALAIVIGPATVAGLRRLGASLVAGPPGSDPHQAGGPEAGGPEAGGPGTGRWGRWTAWWHDPASRTLVLLVGAAVLAVTLANLSGLSKAETERIWLPFAMWLLPAAALLPVGRVRWWLAGQAAVALTVNHLLFTVW